VSGRSVFPVEPWQVRETSLDLDSLAQSESLFALSNGHIGLRGNLDEGEPHAILGSYLAGYYERRPLPYAESGYGYPEDGQSLVNVTNGKLIRLLVEDEPLDLRYGTLRSHERTLDLRAGTLERRFEWISPAGAGVRIRSTRLVSFVQRAVAAISYEVEAVEGPLRLILQSELVANEDQAQVSGDPRLGEVLKKPLEPVLQDRERQGALLVHRTRLSGLLMAAGMDHLIEAPDALVEQDVREDWARTRVACTLEAGMRLRVVKLLGYGWSGQRTAPAMRDQVAAALSGARLVGWEGLVEEQRRYLEDFWDCADVEVEGDPVVQQAVRFALFHVLQAGARTEQRAIGAKGLTGPGYDGHAFWDTEGYILPVLSLTAPTAAADALRWRASTLETARQRAGTLGLCGAAFPWRTVAGQECSAYWPAGTAGFHVNADIAYAVETYVAATDDREFEAETGVPLLVETARLWASLGNHDGRGRWHINGVTGPDEYSAVQNDNVFTNLMAARNLRTAADACARHPERAESLDVTSAEIGSWRTASAAVCLPYDEDLGVHQQSRDFTNLAEWPFEDYRQSYPLLLHAPYVQLYGKQVVKQADLVLAMHLCGESFSAEQKARNLDYYERRTVRDSSLSACTQAVMCAEVGHLELAHRYATEAALVDLRDLHSNSGSGMHIASLAGTWTALVAGFGGVRIRGEDLLLDPSLPEGISRLDFRLRWRGARLRVRVDREQVVVEAHAARATVVLAGESVEVAEGAAVTRALSPRHALLPEPEQPPGRAPLPVNAVLP
jgi:alpha,alpha-trehalose phosphorylase